ncbi:MAG: peptidoglycan editing factor PgeF [Clostridia bacterium]|nr:peptidoglycan editing factor PgeF [Clostridia bacterium]
MNKYTNNEIEHIILENGIEYLQFKKLKKYNDKLIHATFLRHGGESAGIYNSLNLRLASKDENVLKNFKKIAEVLDVDEKNICKARQTHTANVLTIDSTNKEEFSIFSNNSLEADAYLMRDKDIYSIITTADCIPIIMYDKEQNIAVNIHSGWKGTIQKIYMKALEKLIINYNSKPDNIIVCLGPSIGKCCFTSKEDTFKQKFIDIWPYEEDYIYYEEDCETFHIDMKKKIIEDLIIGGIKEENISNAEICTKCNNTDFYSYRVTTQNKEEDYATFGTVVGLK